MSSVSLRIDQELVGNEKKGIGSILGSSMQMMSEKRQSLKRAFSADMSSKKWLAGNYLPISLKKTASAEEFSTINSTPNSPSDQSSSEEEQEEKKVLAKKKPEIRPDQLDIWSSIQSQKSANADSLPITPYIHPLVKRSKSVLSQKSLEICTESLGSETGSDGYSSSDYLTSDSSDDDDEEEERKEDEVLRDEMQGTQKELVQVKYSCSVSRKSPTRSFPPPLPTLSRRDGPCFQMRPLRQDGRLIVEAVPVMSHKFLHAEREGGRLRLSFANSPCEKERLVSPEQQEDSEIEFMGVEQDGEVLEQKEEEEEDQEEEEIEPLEEGDHHRGILMELKAVKREEERMRVGQPILAMSKIMGGIRSMHLNNPNPWEAKKFDGQDHERKRVSPILAAASFNRYDRCWKSGPMAHSAKETTTINNKLLVSKKPLVFKGEDLLSVNRCNEYGRRPVVVREPFCIATT